MFRCCIIKSDSKFVRLLKPVKKNNEQPYLGLSSLIRYRRTVELFFFLSSDEHTEDGREVLEASGLSTVGTSCNGLAARVPIVVGTGCWLADAVPPNLLKINRLHTPNWAIASENFICKKKKQII